MFPEGSGLLLDGITVLKGTVTEAPAVAGSSKLAFDGAGDTLTSAKESKLAQLSLDDVVSCATYGPGAVGCVCGSGAVEGGSGTASKSINEVSDRSSAGFPLEDAKLLEDAVLWRGGGEHV